MEIKEVSGILDQIEFYPTRKRGLSTSSRPISTSKFTTYHRPPSMMGKDYSDLEISGRKMLSGLQDSLINYQSQQDFFPNSAIPVKKTTLLEIKQIQPAQHPKSEAKPRIRVDRRCTTVIKVYKKRLHPITPIEGKLTKRLSYARRYETRKATLLIFNFEGVIGDYYKQYLWSNDLPSLCFRHKALASLQNLSVSYQIAILFSCNEIKAKQAFAYILQKGVYIDAAYLCKQNLVGNDPHSYNQIYDDFELPLDVSKAAIVSYFL